MAAAAQVNEWHSLDDTSGRKRIIGGLTVEVLDKLWQRNAVEERERKSRGKYYIFNSAELVLELDALIAGHGIRLFLKAPCVGAIREGDRIDAILIEDKSGRRAIRAGMFIDASGDGDLLRRAGFAAWQNEILQPVSYQMLAAGLNRLEEKAGRGIWDQVKHRAAEFSYPLENARPWVNGYPSAGDISNIYSGRLYGVDASDADQLTAAVMEGRRRHRAFLDMVRGELGPEVSAVSMAHGLGIRDTWHARCLHRLTASELLSGEVFPDSIGRGTYPVDVHAPEATFLRYLDGREEVVGHEGVVEWKRWRDENAPTPDCYHIPYRSLVPETAANLLVAGRLLDADREAFGGARVMVNMNQTGEAAGVASFLALKQNCMPRNVDAGELRMELARGGSLIQ